MGTVYFFYPGLADTKSDGWRVALGGNDSMVIITTDFCGWSRNHYLGGGYYAAKLRSILGGTRDLAETGDKGKAPAAEPSQRGDSDDETNPPPPPVVASVGASGVGPSGASTSYTVPEVPRDIFYYDQIRQVPYRILDVSVGVDMFGSLAGVSLDEVKFGAFFVKIFIPCN